jgi:hypothetical protein
MLLSERLYCIRDLHSCLSRHVWDHAPFLSRSSIHVHSNASTTHEQLHHSPQLITGRTPKHQVSGILNVERRLGADTLLLAPSITSPRRSLAIHRT